jgi:spore coat protein CotH
VRVHLDYGEGSVYLGLYTMIEDASDEMLEAQFGDDSGNLYKPDGDAARWNRFDEQAFVKKTNEDEADWSDVIAAIDALHSDRSDAEAWRNRFEAVFDAPAFLRVLAINQAMVNWDSYGFMTHNYYVYADPTDGGRLTWFPWDLNESMLVMRGGPGGRGGADPTSVMLDDMGDDWPVIRFLLDDPVYRALYRDELEAFLDGAFAIDTVHEMMDRYHALVAPWVSGENGENAPYSNLRNQQEFDDALTGGQTGLKPHVESRHDAVRTALGME